MMDIGVWIGIASLILGGISIWMAKRCKLRVEIDSRPWISIPEEGISEHVKIDYRGTRVEKLHMVTFRVGNVGRKDIAPGHFDPGAPLRLKLGGRVLEVVRSTHSERVVVSEVDDADGCIEILPMLITRREFVVVQVLVSGESDPGFSGKLADTGIVCYIDGSRVNSRRGFLLP